MTRSLIVPVNVQALPITPKAIQAVEFRGALGDFGQLNRAWPGGAVGDLFPYCAEFVDSLLVSDQVPGVALHWALPDGITRGAHDGTSVSFGRAPDRWLVTRTAWQEGDPRPRVKSWVMAADRVHDDGGGATMPASPGQAPARNLGKVFDLDAWRETATRAATMMAGGAAAHERIDLTALGYGEVTFSSYFPSATNVFGLFDHFDRTLAEEDGGGAGFGAGAIGRRYRLTYLVLGWFSDATVDPLHPGNKVLTPAQPDPQWRAGPDTLPWTYPGDATPTASLYSGFVQGVDWNPDTPDGGLGSSVADVEVAIANTGPEALSVLIARQADMAVDADAELLLNAVQAGLALRDHSGGEAAKLHQTLHLSGFSAASGGSLWVVKPATPNRAPDAGLSDTAASLPDELAGKLNGLNAAQRRYDIASARLDDIGRQVFDDWYRYIVQPDGPHRADLLNIISGETHARNGQWVLFANACGLLTFPADPKLPFDPETPPLAAARPGTTPDPENLAGAVVAAWTAVKAMIAPAKPPLRLLRTPAPRFWQPNDPVVLLRGKDTAPVDRWGRGESLLRPGLLACRLAEQIVGSVAHQGGVTLGVAALAGRAFPQVVVGDVAQALLAETRLNDPLNRDAVAALLAQAAGLNADDARAQVEALQAALAAGSTSAGQLTCAGTPPIALARMDGSTPPWLPLLLEWQADYHPLVYAASGIIAPDAVTSTYGWNSDEADLTSAHPLPTGKQHITGAVVLTPHATADLAQQIDTYLAGQAQPDAELKDVRKRLQRAPVLSQALGGFNQALLMRKQSVQLDLRPEDPDDPDDVALVAGARTAVGPLNDLAPSPSGHFSPVRGGYLRLSALRLIDAFGRVRSVDLTTSVPVPASSLAPDDAELLRNGYAFLPPRLAQPSRLMFRWLAASDDQVEMNDHPASCPIVGWVLPNVLDDSLMIYAADGDFRGSLELFAGGTRRRWRGAPAAGGPVHPDGEGDGVGDIPKDVTDGHLLAFVTGLFGGGADYLDGMIRMIDRACATIVPPEVNIDPSLGVLVGRPLALARARLGLELQGLPAVRRGFDDIKPPPDYRIDKDAMLPSSLRDDAGFTGVAFDVLLGHFRLAADGLVAYFRNGDYGRVFSLAAQAASGRVLLPEADPIALTADPRPQKPAEIVTLLLDPRAEVHARIGILPAKSLTVPPDQYVQAMKALQPFFYAGPVLANDVSDLPLPAITGFAWTWFDPSGGTWRVRPLRGKAGDRVVPGYSPLRICEGWLRLSREPATGQD